MDLGLISDVKRCPEPQQIIDRFAVEFEQMLLLTMMLPWAGQDLG